MYIHLRPYSLCIASQELGSCRQEPITRKSGSILQLHTIVVASAWIIILFSVAVRILIFQTWSDKCQTKKEVDRPLSGNGLP